MLDDGEIETPRPWTDGNRITAREDDGETHGPSRSDTFAAAWAAEVAAVPEFSDSTIHIVAGLLLPIWKRLPNGRRVSIGSRPTRARIVGRKVSPPGPQR